MHTFEIKSTGLVREVFTDYTNDLPIKTIKEVELAAGDTYLEAYAKKLVADNTGSVDTIKAHLQRTYDLFMSDGRCTDKAWASVLKILYPIQDDRRIISELITASDEKFPELPTTVVSGEALEPGVAAHTKASVYGSIVQSTFDNINKRFGKVLTHKIQ